MSNKMPGFRSLTILALLTGTILAAGCDSPDKVTRTTTTEQTATRPAPSASSSTTTTTTEQTHP
jgi:hypothetical protein